MFQRVQFDRDAKKSKNQINSITMEKNIENHFNEPERRNFVVEVIKSAFTDSTAHGLSPLVKRENTFIRIVWLSCLLVSAGVCAYMITLSILSFFSYEVVSKTESVYLLSTEFPAVTLCNQNALMTSKALDFATDLFIRNGLVNPIDPQKSFKNTTAASFLFYRYFAGNNALDPNRTDEFRKSLGYNMSDMLFSCLYNFLECSADEFKWSFNILYGNCFTFNAGA